MGACVSCWRKFLDFLSLKQEVTARLAAALPVCATELALVQKLQEAAWTPEGLWVMFWMWTVLWLEVWLRRT